MSDIRGLNRRRFLAALGLAAALPSWGQKKPARIAWLSSSTEADGRQFFEELRRGLTELGYSEGRNMAFEKHWADDSRERLERVAKELVATQPSIVVAQGPTVPALRRAGAAFPIVFGFSGDPVEAGYVKSLARPGGNLTGMSFMSLELAGKRVELLKEFIPEAKRIAVVANPQHPGDQSERRVSQEAATKAGLDLRYYESRNASDLEAQLEAIAKSGADAVLMFPVASIMARRARIAQWAVEKRIPTISGWAQFADGGNLMAYGPNLRASFRRLAFFADRILKGAQAADIPVELPSSVELIVNLRAAAALGRAVPKSLLLRADRVIE
ncbi:MAG TPA: ABC transporter substrate-binding protein [Burkholderiales bacterium]